MSLDTLPVPSISAGTASIGQVGGNTAVINSTLTRPANITAYTAGDIITDTGGAIQTFTGCARANGGTGMVVKLTAILNEVPAARPQLELWLLDTTATPAADNAAFAPTDAVAQTVVAIIPLTETYIGDPATTGNIVYQASGLNIPFKCGGSSTALFGMVVTRIAFTPIANSSTLLLRLHVLQD